MIYLNQMMKTIQSGFKWKCSCYTKNSIEDKRCYICNEIRPWNVVSTYYNYIKPYKHILEWINTEKFLISMIQNDKYDYQSFKLYENYFYGLLLFYWNVNIDGVATDILSYLLYKTTGISY